MFSYKTIIKLPKYTKINNSLTNPKKDKQLYYKSIYSFEPMELKMIMTYIEIHFSNEFVRCSKSFTEVFILFV